MIFVLLDRPHFLMHECNRVLNGETAETGPCRAANAEVVNTVTLGNEAVAEALNDTDGDDVGADGERGDDTFGTTTVYRDTFVAPESRYSSSPDSSR